MTTAKTTNETAPVDVAEMRKIIGRLLPPSDAEPIAHDELEDVAGELRRHIEQLIPEVQALAMAQPKEDIPRYVALAAIREAQGRLGRISATPGWYGALVSARRLARALNALCDHYESLPGNSPS